MGIVIPLLLIDYFTTPLDLVIITEFSDWLWEHIFVNFQGKKKIVEIQNP